MFILRMKRWLAQFIRECLLVDEQARNWSLVFTCPFCAKSVPLDAQFCSCCGKHVHAWQPILPLSITRDTDPIEVVATKPLFLPRNNR